MNALLRELDRRVVVHAASRCDFPSVNAQRKPAAFQVTEGAAISSSLNI